MTEDFENRLRAALRPVNAPAGLAERIIAALPPRPVPATVTSIADAPQRRAGTRRYGMPAALAASLVGAVLLGMFAAEQRARVIAERDEAAAGQAASRALMDALRVTSQKLDLAYQAVNPPPAPATDEENRT
jgi:hypothetical protein